MAFGKKLQDLLEARNVSIAEAARITGIPDSTIRSIIARDSEEVAISVAVKIAKGFKISIDEIQGWGSVPQLPRDDEKALSMIEQKRRELLDDLSLLSPDEQEQIVNMIRFFAKRKEGPAAHK